MTARDDEDFAALLVLGDYCDGSIKTFANEYASRTIQFDGAIVNMMNHGSYDTRFDILLSPGDFDPNSAQGPSFKYQDVSVFDLELTGKKSRTGSVSGTSSRSPPRSWSTARTSACSTSTRSPRRSASLTGLPDHRTWPG